LHNHYCPPALRFLPTFALRVWEDPSCESCLDIGEAGKEKNSRARQATAGAATVLANLQLVVAMTSNSPIAVGRSSYNGLSARRPAVQGLSKLLLLALAQVSHVAAVPLRDYLGHSKNAHIMEHPEAEDPSLWLYLAVAAVLVLLGGAFAGLTIA
jgi:hypothetical protein